MAAAKKGQSEARRAARAALSSARKAGLMISLARWINIAGESAFPAADAASRGNAAPAPARKNLCRFASRKIRRRHRRLLHDARGGALTDLSVEARHRIRIDAKRLRYAADFFSSLFNEKKVARYVDILGQIQNLLGEVNDNAIAMHLLDGLAPPGPFMDFAAAWFSARTEQKLDGVHRYLVELKDTRHFWAH
jgi:CHAD domain-containing protein